MEESLKSCLIGSRGVYITTIDKNEPNLSVCIDQVRSVFMESVFILKPVLADARFRQMAEADITKELKTAINDPNNHALFIGIEELDGKKKVVAISHVRLGSAAPKGGIVIQWIGSPKVKGGGDELIKHILDKYKNGNYEDAYAGFPGERTRALDFLKKHGFKKRVTFGDGKVYLMRKL